MLKKILIGLAALVAIFLVVVAMQPSDFQMARSTTIAAPPANVFAQVNDFHKWEAWSPWAKPVLFAATTCARVDRLRTIVWRKVSSS